MKVYVDQDRCIAAGQCVAHADEVFDQREDDGIVDEGWPSGCNGRTLLEARRHFADGLMSCARGEEPFALFGGGDIELEALKRQILTCAAGLRLLDDGPDFAAGRRRLDALLAELEAATATWLRRSERARR